MKFLQDLQNKPHEKKIRILKIAAVIAIIFILVIWTITLRARKTENREFPQLEKFWNDLKDIKSKVNGQGSQR